MDSVSPTGRILLALIPKISGTLSVIGSALIALNVASTKQPRNTYQRLLCSLALVDAMSTTSLLLSTWPIPKEEDNLAWNIGNNTSCKVQGFFVQLKVVSFLLAVALFIFYTARVRFSVSSETIAQHEWILHTIPYGLGFLTALFGALFDLYGSSYLWCWIESNHVGFRLGFLYGPLVLCLFIGGLCVVLIFRTVHFQERQVAQNNTSSCGTVLTSEEFKLTRQVGKEALLYVLAFYFSSFFAIINRLFETVTGNPSFVLLLLNAIFIPLQGFLNAVIYSRPMILMLLRGHAQLPWWQAVARAVAHENDQESSQLGRHSGSSPMNMIISSNKSQDSTVQDSKNPSSVTAYA